MNQERLLKVIVAPHISEKSTVAADKAGQFIFKVAIDATKREIKSAVEQLFEVEVADVKTMNVRGKMKYTRTPGKRPNWKKAIVCLKPGQDIDFASA
jgi:large subunit ribosomal protein L23